MDKYVARSHFGRFGTLVNFVLRPRRMTCTVSYASEDEAARALLDGASFQGHLFDISYADNETAPAQKTEEWVDPDIQAELSALQSGWRNEYGSGKPIKKPQNGSSGSGGSSMLPAIPVGPATAPVSRDRTPAQLRDLENMMRRPAHTSEEKFSVLDARDKLLRLNRTQHKLSGATQGHCADMCPEKERVLREFQRQVAYYELQPGSDELICHERALKQYSRSSADQETPLPHELRNETALHMTMSYLMHEIMDISERQDPQSHMGDWFHFVWDRTRSIRKEITQQELCSLGAVKLVEQCARFHIHCAARLVDADPSVFDSKINAENLTKCLQTLKYMYHDLRIKGVPCPKEAEFRGYIVLLNLADANFLWDIGQLPAELQSCPEVRQAIQFYLALQDTNFVRFFQLLADKDTSYLSACILVNYFTRLRVLGLHRLIQAYRSPRKDEVSSLPLSYIAELLSFASEQEAADFVQHYGLQINEAGRVVLSRMHTVETEYKLPRQYEVSKWFSFFCFINLIFIIHFQLVEVKRVKSVGEVVSGEPLPPRDLYLNHRPHNSFDDYGMLKSIAWTAKDQLAGMQQEEMQPQMPSQPPAVSKHSDTLFKVPMQPDGTAAGFGVFAAAAVPPASSIDGFSFVLPKSRAQEFQEQAPATQQRRAQEEAKHQALQVAIAAAKKREAELMAIHEAKVAEAERVRQQKLRERQEQQRRQQQELEEQRQREQEKLQLEKERQLKLEQLFFVQQQEREAHKQTRTLELYQEIFQDTLAEICQSEFMSHSRACRSYESMLDSITRDLVERQMEQSIYELGVMRVCIRRWRKYRRTQQEKDTLFNQLPLSFGAENPEGVVNKRSMEDSLRLSRRYRLGEPCDYGKLLAGLEEHSWLKLDLWHVLDKCLPVAQPGARRFYKLLISLSGGQEGLQLNCDLDRGLLQQPQSPDARFVDGGYIRGFSQGIGLSVMKIRDDDHDWKATDLAEANGIICLIGLDDIRLLPDRLKPLLQASRCHDVAVIVQHPANTAFVQPDIPLQELCLRSFNIFRLRKSGNNRQRLMIALESAVKFLAKATERKRVGHLHQVETREYLLVNLGSELFRRLKYAAEHDTAIRSDTQLNPQRCVDLFNEAVHRLQLVAGEDLSDWPQFPEELRVFVQPLPIESSLNTNRLEHFEPGWHLPERRQRIVQLLERCKLPKMPVLPRSSSLAEAQCQWVLDYAQISQQEDRVEQIALQAIKILQYDTDDYLNFVEYLAGERMQYILRQERNPPQGVVYNTKTLKRRFLSAWYYEFREPQIYEPVPAEENAQMLEKQPSSQAEVQQLDFDEITSKAEAVLKRFHQRQDERHTLRELNRSHKSRKRRDASDHKHASKHKRKRSKSK